MRIYDRYSSHLSHVHLCVLTLSQNSHNTNPCLCARSNLDAAQYKLLALTAPTGNGVLDHKICSHNSEVPTLLHYILSTHHPTRHHARRLSLTVQSVLMKNRYLPGTRIVGHTPRPTFSRLRNCWPWSPILCVFGVHLYRWGS